VRRAKEPPVSRPVERDLAAWETHRPHLLAQAYKMLGDLARAEDVLQEAMAPLARARRRRPASRSGPLTGSR
jgi:DNA-directed RNA polymerase specialized sigma24 family protein